MQYQLPKLPYELHELEPHISKETLTYHYHKHQQTYVSKFNEMVVSSDFNGSTIEEIIQKANGPLFNNAAQAWNHTFYFNCLTPRSTAPSDKLLSLITKHFGSIDQFQAEFTKASLGNFGSGWTWLIIIDGKLEIANTSNADTPLRHDKHIPLLACDVWEHAYYIDYRNVRAEYLAAFWKLVNWDFVSNNLP